MEKEPAPAKVPAILEPIVSALGRLDGVTVEKGWGSSNVTLKVRGKIFAMVQGSGLVVKLPKARVDALVNVSLGKRFDPRRDGRQMKEWVVLSKRRNDWVDLAREALMYVGGTP